MAIIGMGGLFLLNKYTPAVKTTTATPATSAPVKNVKK